MNERRPAIRTQVRRTAAAIIGRSTRIFKCAIAENRLQRRRRVITSYRAHGRVLGD